MTRKYWNQSERYGDQVRATLADYLELNPSGQFTETTRNGQAVIVETLKRGDEIIATQKRNG